MNIFHLKIKLLNDENMDDVQMKYIENNIRYFIRAIKNSLAIGSYCVHLENSKELGNFFLVHYETGNQHNILLNRIMEIAENEILGKYPTDDKNWNSIEIKIIE